MTAAPGPTIRNVVVTKVTLAGPQRLKGTYSPEAFLLVAKVLGGVPSINLHS